MNIIELVSQNVKRLRAVRISPDKKPIVEIAGRNKQGKSSVLDSIEFAIGGKPRDKMPVRKGEEKATIVIDLGELLVKRTFTAAGGTTLTVTNADGVKQSMPQAILDKLASKVTFDPLEFSRQKPEMRAETLRGLVGLDFSAMEIERAQLYAQRTDLNRDAKQVEARFTRITQHKDAPDSESSTADVLKKQAAAIASNETSRMIRSAHGQAQSDLNTASARHQSAQASVAIKKRELLEAQVALAEADETRLVAQAKLKEAKAKADALGPDEDVTTFWGELARIEEGNGKWRENHQREELVQQYKTIVKNAGDLTDKIARIDSDRRRAINGAKFPINGLSFDASGGGVSYNGIPFEQCSQAECLAVSVAIGLALNPKLKILLIRDGSLLDEESLATISSMAEAAGAQVWIERVGAGSETAVIIEDGMVMAKDTPAPNDGPDQSEPKED